MTIENEKKPTETKAKPQVPFEGIRRLIEDYDDDFPAPSDEEKDQQKESR